MADLTPVQALGRFAADTRDHGVPPDVARSVRQRVLDVLGLQLAALHLDTSRSALAFAADQAANGPATVVGSAVGAPATWAAFANGVLAHSLDYDDTHLPSIVHPSASVVPAALAAAERVGAAGDVVVPAVAAGLEVVVRTAMAGYDVATGNSTFFEHGQHATSICGTLGAAAAAAVVTGLDAAGIAHAIAVAASMAGGIIEANRTGGTVKRLHCGWAAHAGVSAAQLVQHGFTGPPTALEGRFGLFEAFLHGSDVAVDQVTEGLGAQWSVPGIFFKPYPANHFTHAGIDAGRRLRRAGLRSDDIAHITLRVATPTVRTIGEPIELKRHPRTGYQAQFSGPYTVVAGLLGGGGLGVDLDDFTDELAVDPLRVELMSLVDVVGDADCDAVYPQHFPAIVEVRCTDGRRLVERVMANRGSPADPLEEEELAMKFRGNARTGLPRADADRLVNLVSDLEHHPIAAVMALLAAAAPVAVAR